MYELVVVNYEMLLVFAQRVGFLSRRIMFAFVAGFVWERKKAFRFESLRYRSVSMQLRRHNHSEIFKRIKT